jgi:predicted protein tyrosine phosphatase
MLFNWVLFDELAIGSAPTSRHDLEFLRMEGIRSVLTLCRPDESHLADGLNTMFRWTRLELPDHRCGHPPEVSQIAGCLELVSALVSHGPIYVHCIAAAERSPLVAIGWLMRRKHLNRLQALEYLMQVHPPTNPLPEQLAILDDQLHITALPA